MGDIKTVAEYDIYNANFSVLPVDASVKKSLLAYMRSFKPAWRSASPVFDPVAGVYTDIQCDAFTDGEWGWDSTDIYLFDEYGLKLDKRFVSAHS